MNRLPDPANVLTVSNINQYIKSLLTADVNLSDIYVSGEISNFKIYNSGHAYFSLKDSGGLLKCVMFSRFASALDFAPRDGMKVLVYGSISLYERDGVYQLYAERMIPDGVGALYLAYEQRRKTLAAEGLFDSAQKKPIPRLPARVGVITSESGAVIRDIQNVIGRRFPTMPLLHIHVSVQGENAAPEIVRALRYVSSTRCCDVVIIGRGGGSIEDLWAFNEESVVRAVAACTVPVISAVGHETDYTLTDFAADLRAPTPSAAAELAVPVLEELWDAVRRDREKILALPLANCRIKQMELDRLKQSRIFTRPLERIESESLSAERDSVRMRERITQSVLQNRQKLELLAAHLEALNPAAVLKRGYSIVYRQSGTAVLAAQDVQNEELIEIQTGNGRFTARREDQEVGLV